MARAIFVGEILAESEDVKKFEGNYYFPKESVRMEFLHEVMEELDSDLQTRRKDYTIRVRDNIMEKGAWEHLEPVHGEDLVIGYIGFSPEGVRIEI